MLQKKRSDINICPDSMLRYSGHFLYSPLSQNVETDENLQCFTLASRS